MSARPISRIGTVLGSLMLLAFGAFWCVMLGFLDNELARIVWLQGRTLNYSETRGKIIESSVESLRGRKGGYTHGVKVRYEFTIGGSNYLSDRYAWQATKASGSKWAYDAVARNRKGASVPVYYDPAKPEDSVLGRGLDGSDLMVLLFLTPFHVIAAGLLCASLSTLFSAFAPFPRRVITEPGGRERIDVADLRPLTAFMVALGFAAFVGIFLTAIPFGFHPPVWYVSSVWLICIGLALWSALTTARRISRGHCQLIIDRHAARSPSPQCTRAKSAANSPFATSRKSRFNRFSDLAASGTTPVTKSVSARVLARNTSCSNPPAEAKANVGPNGSARKSGSPRENLLS